MVENLCCKNDLANGKKRYNLINIKSAQFDRIAYKHFKGWLVSEWSNVEQMYDEDTRQLPMPLLAFENDLLVGGMSFILYNRPDTSTETIWINTVYVTPDYRGKGVASLLIRSAEEVVTHWHQSEMYVFRDKPGLYNKLGWHLLIEEDEGFVLNKQLIEKLK